jgi:signal transduction histidine kinase
VYFCVLEALNNVAKYAEATSAEVSLAQIDGHLRFAVVDDGTGFDTAETSYGTGVQGMADRLDAIGGTLQVVSRKGGGTTIEGRIPTPTNSDPRIADALPRSG